MHCSNAPKTRTQVHLAVLVHFGSHVYFNALGRHAAKASSCDPWPSPPLRHPPQRGDGRHVCVTVWPQFIPDRSPFNASAGLPALCCNRRSMTPMDGAARDTGTGCGKVPNRTSRPIRSVRHLHRISCSAGTRSLSMRLPPTSSAPNFTGRSLTEETEKREFQRHARVAREARAYRSLFGND